MTKSTRILGVCEQPRRDSISAAVFVDAETLISAKLDRMIAVCTVSYHENEYALDIHGTMHDHLCPMHALFLSTSLRPFVLSDTGNQEFPWDLTKLMPFLKLSCPTEIDVCMSNSYISRFIEVQQAPQDQRLQQARVDVAHD